VERNKLKPCNREPQLETPNIGLKESSKGLKKNPPKENRDKGETR